VQEYAWLARCGKSVNAKGGVMSIYPVARLLVWRLRQRGNVN